MVHSFPTRRSSDLTSDAVALEDSVAGATAARRASMLVICVPTLAEVEIDADLRVSRLDHPAVFSQFGLERPRSADGRPMPIPDEARS